MTIEDLICYGKKYLHTNEVYMLLSNLLNYDNLELLNYLDKKVEDTKVMKFKEMIEKVINEEPIQYVLGNVNFFGYTFTVDKNVLIPRFETEELVSYTIDYINKFFNENVSIIDLGCGSGNIGITLKKKIENSKVTCVDISEEALKIAKNNANILEVDITFIKNDMLDNIKDKYNVIISNPPYISRNEDIEDIVRNNEPHLALFADNDGLYFYEKILSTCKENLQAKFLIAFEIGMNQKDKIIDIIHKYFTNVTIDCKKDLSGRDRMIFIYNE